MRLVVSLTVRTMSASISTTSPSFCASSLIFASTSAFRSFAPISWIDHHGVRESDGSDASDDSIIPHLLLAVTDLALSAARGQLQHDSFRQRRPRSLQDAQRPFHRQVGSPREVVGLRARVLVHHVQLLPQGGPLLLHVPGRAEARRQGHQRRNPTPPVHGVSSCCGDAVLFCVRPPVREDGGGREDGNPGY